MQKALQQMNVQLNLVLSDITGVTGMQIVRAIVAGERDRLVLARFRQPGCRSTGEEIAKALTGNYRPEHVFALKQALTLYDTYTQQLAECDRQLAQQYTATKPRFDPDDPEHPLGPDPKPNSHSKNAPNFDARTPLFQLSGVDLVAVSGFDESMAQTILAEIGTDMHAWPTVKHFCSWLGLAPHNDITGGRVVRSRTLKNHNRAAQALRMAAEAAGRGKDAIGAYYRRMRARVGAQQAITATAHKLARIIYHMLRDRQSFQAVTAQAYDDQQQHRELTALQRRAAKLGLTLQPKPTG